MADIAPRLVELSAGKLHSLHQRLHKSELTPEVLEVHHLVINEALRRGLMRVEEDAWDRYEIEIDYLENVDISNFSESLPEDAVSDLVSKMGSSIGNIRTVLTVNGYELRIEEPKEEPINNRLPEIQSFSKEKNYAPPKGVRVAARRAVEWISEGKAGNGFTSVGRMRAQQLSAGENISLATLKRMKSFFSRHEVDKDALGFSQGEKGYPSPGRVAWDAWGGDAGFSWAESQVAQAENALEKHLQGQHDQKSHAGDYARRISDELEAGGHPTVAPEDISALFGGMAKLTSHPDITELKVKGTLLFGDEGMGIARSDMPQIPTSARDKFLADIEKDNGITFEKEKVDPTTLKPIQKEVSGSRAGAIYEKFAEKGKIPKDERILISKDGYVVDGHHTWAASVAFSFDNPGTELPVYRLSVNAKEALQVSLDYAKENGYESKAIDDNAKYSDGKEIKKSDVFKHGEGDQKPHGNWADSGSSTDESSTATSMSNITSMWIGGTEAHPFPVYSEMRGAMRVLTTEDSYYPKDDSNARAEEVFNGTKKILTELIDAEPSEKVLYRGLAMDKLSATLRSGDIKTLTTEGATFTENLSTWTSNSELADSFSRGLRGGRELQEEGAVGITMRVQGLPSIPITKYYPSDLLDASPVLKSADEHIASGVYKVLKVSKLLGGYKYDRFMVDVEWKALPYTGEQLGKKSYTTSGGLQVKKEQLLNQMQALAERMSLSILQKPEVAKHGEGDQKPHGSWAHGGGDSAIPALAPDKEPEAKWSPEAVAKARAIREKALAVEPKITELMKTVQKNSGGEFVQLNERVKSTNSLASKIDREAVSEFDGDRSRAADAVSDAVRYTLKVGDENYAQALDSTTKALEASGFTLRVKNFWQSGDPYDGINIKARKDGIEVEVQLHTRSSFAHKEGEGGTHPIYKAYQTELNDPTRQTMWNQMIDIAKGVTRPANYGAILATGTLILQKFQTAQEAGLIKSTPVDIISPERTEK